MKKAYLLFLIGGFLGLDNIYLNQKKTFIFKSILISYIFIRSCFELIVSSYIFNDGLFFVLTVIGGSNILPLFLLFLVTLPNLFIIPFKFKKNINNKVNFETLNPLMDILVLKPYESYLMFGLNKKTVIKFLPCILINSIFIIITSIALTMIIGGILLGLFMSSAYR